MTQNLQTITLGGGCFWCTESVFVAVKGITDVESGYCNGETINPSYEQVCTGRTGHNEVVKLVFDPATITLQDILAIFFVIHDPTTLNRQGNDTGTQYRSGIYYSSTEHAHIAQNFIAQASQEKLFSAKIVTEVVALSNYSAAEDYHQDYFERNPFQGYCMAVAAPKVAKFRKVFSQFAK